jgi:hypothetical protein
MMSHRGLSGRFIIMAKMIRENTIWNAKGNLQATSLSPIQALNKVSMIDYEHPMTPRAYKP